MPANPHAGGPYSSYQCNVCGMCSAIQMGDPNVCHNANCRSFMVPQGVPAGMVMAANQGWASNVVTVAKDLPPPTKTLGINTCFNIAGYLERYRQLTQSRAEDDELKLLINLLTLTKAASDA